MVCCAGSQPKGRDDFDSVIEKYPKKLFQWLVKPLPCKIVILVGFAGYLAASIYGLLHLEQGLQLKNLAADDHHFYKHDTWSTDYFPNHIPISFVIKSRLTYSTQATQTSIASMLSTARTDIDIDGAIEINWLAAYQNDASYTTVSESEFVTNLASFIGNNPQYDNDVLFDVNKTHIEASRFYVFTNDLKDSQKQGNMMQRMRAIADKADLSAFPYNPYFVFFEQYVVILSATVQTVGIAVAAMTVITIIFMPYPILVVLVMVTMVMILVGIFGFMFYWDISLSSITMIQLVMTVGFSVDFSAHICHGFISVSGESRMERVYKSLERTGGPIINAAFSSIVGILMLLASSGYIFRTFFKLMFLVMLFGLLHSVLFLPVLLSLIGPKPADHDDNAADDEKHESKSNNENNITNDSLPPADELESSRKSTVDQEQMEFSVKL